MKQKMNARQKREAQEFQRKKTLKQQQHPAPAEEVPSGPQAPEPVPKPKAIHPSGTPEEEAMVFLEYLAREHMPVFKDDLPPQQRKKNASGRTVPKLNLEEGMPTVEEAVSRMNIGLQEMRVTRAGTVKLIHGYGSTGRGGRICTGVRNELAAMKRKKLIKNYIPGEDFGPMDAASRKLAEQDRSVTRDPDYGRMNHGITIVIL